jgi:hypothetical protein
MEENKLTLLRNAIGEGENSGMVEDFKAEQHLNLLHKTYKPGEF